MLAKAKETMVVVAAAARITLGRRAIRLAFSPVSDGIDMRDIGIDMDTGVDVGAFFVTGGVWRDHYPGMLGKYCCPQ